MHNNENELVDFVDENYKGFKILIIVRKNYLYFKLILINICDLKIN